ncbi:MAG: hypothetical protein KGI54_11560 [Pseudomonadota bacterium]|nr:hypothetical protein [Pseudomonadota bacterium]
MPYSKAPVTSTYGTKRVSFVASPQQRSGALPNKDLRLINMMTEVISSPLSDSKKFFVKSRPGLNTEYTTTTGASRGIYYWVYSGVDYIFAVVGTGVYVNGVLKQTLTTSTGEVGFTEFVSSTGTVSLVLVDGVKGYVFYNGTAAPTLITDADFPTPHCPNPIFLDGYLFLAKKDSQDVYNSNLDDPTLWTAGDFISAEMYPDKIVALSKNNNYIYAVGANSIEYLYDIATSIGSPLGRQASAVQQFGCAAPATVVQTEKEVILVGETGNGGHTVWTIDGFKENEIGIPMVKSALLNEGSALANATAHCIRVSGQKLYCINLTSRTLVYSFDTKMWSEWSSGPTGGNAFIANQGHDGPNGKAFMLDKTNGKVYSISETYFTDAGTAFECQLVTSKMDFDIMNRKFMSRLSIVGDVPDSTGTDNSITVDWTDDDYNTWSAARTLSFNYDFPVLKQLGNFRRRAFRFKYALPHLLRLEGIEVDINKGSQ